MAKATTRDLAVNGGSPVREEPYPPWPKFWDEEIEAATEVLKSGDVNYWTGDKGEQFQDRFADYVGRKHAVAVNSGTAALHAGLAAVGVGPGDEVIVPCRTFIATAASVLHQSAVPIFADVDPETECIDPSSIREHITPRTKAIIPVHLYGHPAEMDEIMDIADRNDLYVIEDCAQAHGATYKGQMIGTFGEVGAFSFCQDKIMTTGGEGGMVVTDDPDYLKIIQSIKDHGYWEEEHRELLEEEAVETYIHHEIGWNYRMTEMQSAIGLVLMDKLDNWIEKRRSNAAYLREGLSDIEPVEVQTPKDYVKHTYYKFPCHLDLDSISVDRNQFVKAVEKEGVGIASGTAPEVYKEEVFQDQIGFGNTSYPFTNPEYEARGGDIDYTDVSLPAAKDLGKRAFIIQVHPTVDEKDLDDVIAAVRKVCEAYGQ